MFSILEPWCTPEVGTKFSAGIDLKAREDITLSPGETKIIPLGVKLDTDFDDTFKSAHYLGLHIRSGLASKGLIQNNGEGIVDLDYPKELGLIIHYPVSLQSVSDMFVVLINQIFKSMFNRIPFSNPNVSPVFHISKGDKVAQVILKSHYNSITNYSSDQERDGGFGSTGS